MKWRFLIILVICGVVFCGYKRLTYSRYCGAFKEVLAQDLGLQSVPGTIEAEVMENTNLFTLKVTAKIKNDNV